MLFGFGRCWCSPINQLVRFYEHTVAAQEKEDKAKKNSHTHVQMTYRCPPSPRKKKIIPVELVLSVSRRVAVFAAFAGFITALMVDLSSEF